MARKSLRPELNRIRAWVRQGRTDAWIAHQLEVTVQQIQAFKKEQDLEPDAGADFSAGVVDYDDEIDLRAEDDAQVAAALDAELAAAEEAAREAAEREAAEREAAEREAAEREAAEREAAEREAAEREAAEAADEEKPKRRRTRRIGRTTRGRRAAAGPLEATFDHGEEGYGLWLDPAVQDDPVYAEYWAGHRPVEVTIEEEQIVIRRAGPEAAPDAQAE
jgi:hypothetical protein